MNLVIFLDLTYISCKNFKFYSFQGQNVQILLIFTYNEGKIFLTLSITQGGHTSLPGLHWLLPLHSVPSAIKSTIHMLSNTCKKSKSTHTKFKNEEGKPKNTIFKLNTFQCCHRIIVTMYFLSDFTQI